MAYRDGSLARRKYGVVVATLLSLAVACTDNAGTDDSGGGSATRPSSQPAQAPLRVTPTRIHPGGTVVVRVDEEHLMCFVLRSRSQPGVAFELRSDGGDPSEHGLPSWAEKGAGECELLLIAAGVEERLVVPTAARPGSYELCNLRITAGKGTSVIEPCARLVVLE